MRKVLWLQHGVVSATVLVLCLSVFVFGRETLRCNLIRASQMLYCIAGPASS